MSMMIRRRKRLQQKQAAKPVVKETKQPAKIVCPYTRTELMRTNKADLQKLASDVGISDSDGMTLIQLKEALLDYFKL